MVYIDVHFSDHINNASDHSFTTITTSFRLNVFGHNTILSSFALRRVNAYIVSQTHHCMASFYQINVLTDKIIQFPLSIIICIHILHSVTSACWCNFFYKVLTTHCKLFIFQHKQKIVCTLRHIYLYVESRERFRRTK